MRRKCDICGLTEDVKVLEKENAVLVARAEEAEKENTKLRALLAASGAPCPYCNLPAAEMAKCASGFPGCARADDILCGPSHPTRQDLININESLVEVLEDLKRSPFTDGESRRKVIDTLARLR